MEKVNNRFIYSQIILEMEKKLQLLINLIRKKLSTQIKYRY